MKNLEGRIEVILGGLLCTVTDGDEELFSTTSTTLNYLRQDLSAEGSASGTMLRHAYPEGCTITLTSGESRIWGKVEVAAKTEAMNAHWAPVLDIRGKTIGRSLAVKKGKTRFAVCRVISSKALREDGRTAEKYHGPYNLITKYPLNGELNRVHWREKAGVVQTGIDLGPYTTLKEAKEAATRHFHSVLSVFSGRIGSP